MLPYPFVPALNLARPVTIGNKAGNTGVVFSDLAESPTLVEFNRKRKVTLHETAQPGTGVAGWRLVEALQTHPNRWDIEWIADHVTPAQVTRLRGYVEDVDPANPGYVTFHVGTTYLTDPAPTVYLGMMAEDYPIVENYRYNLRVFHKVKIRIHCLGVTAISEITV